MRGILHLVKNTAIFSLPYSFPINDLKSNAMHLAKEKVYLLYFLDVQKSPYSSSIQQLTTVRNSLWLTAKLSPPDLDFNIVSRLGLQHVPASTAWVLIFRQDCRLPQNYSCCGSPGIPVSSSTAPFFKKAKGLWPFLAACGVCPLHGAIPWPSQSF